MATTFVTEAVMLAIYGHLLQPSKPIEYLIPYSTVMELYDMLQDDVPLMGTAGDDAAAKDNIRAMVRFFEEPFNRKKIERSFGVPWRKSPPLIINESVTCVIVNALDNAQFGESFDTIETELVLTAQLNQAPLLTDQLEFAERIVKMDIPAQIFDIEDFDYALESEALSR